MTSRHRVLHALTAALIIGTFWGCSGDRVQSPLAPAPNVVQPPLAPASNVQSANVAFKQGEAGEGAIFEVYPYLGVGISKSPDRPGAVYFDNCQADWLSDDLIPGFVLQLPDGSYALQAGIDLNVDVRVLWSIGTEWEEWLGTGRLQTIDAPGRFKTINITGVVSYNGETRRAICNYTDTAHSATRATIELR